MENLVLEREIIEINVNLENRDYLYLCFKNYFNFATLFYLFFYLFIFGMTLFFIFWGDNFFFSKFIQLLGLAVLFSLIFAFLLVYLAVNSVSRLLNVNTKYIFSDEKVEIQATAFSSQIKWNYFTGVKEKSNYFLFSMKDQRRIIIPKRDFTNLEQLQEFKALLRTKFGNEAYLKKSKENLGLK